MTLRLGDTAPDFQAETTNGPIQLPRVAGRRAGGCSSPTRATSRRCAPPSSATSRALRPEFERRGVNADRALGRSGGLAQGLGRRHPGDAGHAVNFPIIADPDRKVADLYGMIHPNASDDAHRPLRVRDRSREEGAADHHLPAVHRPQLRRDPARDRLAPAHRSPRVATPVNWKPGDDVIIVPAVSDEEARAKFPSGWRALKPYLRLTPAPGRETAEPARR